MDVYKMCTPIMNKVKYLCILRTKNVLCIFFFFIKQLDTIKKYFALWTYMPDVSQIGTKIPINF